MLLRVTLALGIAFSVAHPQKLEIVHWGRDSIHAYTAQLQAVWNWGTTTLEVGTTICAGVRQDVLIVPRGLRVDAALSHWEPFASSAWLGLGIAHTSVHHLDSWAHGAAYGLIYGDWRLIVATAVGEDVQVIPSLEITPVVAAYYPTLITNFPRIWFTTVYSARWEYAIFWGRTRVDLNRLHSFEHEQRLGVALYPVVCGIAVHWTTHFWYELRRSFSGIGVFLSVYQ